MGEKKTKGEGNYNTSFSLMLLTSPEDLHDQHMNSASSLTHNEVTATNNNPGELGNLHHCGPSSGAAQLLAGVASAVSSDSLNLLAASLPQAPIPPHEFTNLADCYDHSLASSSTTEDSNTSTKVYAPEYISL